MGDKILSKMWHIELVFFSCIMCIITVLLTFLEKQGYMCRQSFTYSNGVLLLIGVGLSIVVSFVLGKSKTLLRLERLENKMKYLLIIYFLVLMYISYNIIFQPGWDAGVIVGASRKMVDGELSANYNNYYSLHPNNLLITCIYAVVFKLNCVCGVFDGENEIMALVSFLCLIQTVTAYLVFYILREVLTSRYAVWVTWAVYLIFMGAVPWVLVPYTDAAGVIIPVAIFALYLKQKKKEQITNWIWIGCLIFVGYYIKPQTIIIGIAIVLIEVIKAFSRNKKENLMLKKIFICMIAVVLCRNIYQNLVIPNTGFELDEELELGAEHMLMMGQNLESNGVYSEGDVAFSMSIKTKQERKEANKEKAKERIQIMLKEGTFLSHLQKKALVNFNDGTFAWGKEGGFIKTEYAGRNQFVSPFLKKVIYPSGEYRKLVSTFKQIMWLTILFFCIGVVLLVKSDSSKKEEVVIMSLATIGVFLFVMIFEARARYLYTYVPFLVILASIGYCEMRKSIIKIYTSIKESKNNG